jgi:hypothetical protein
LPAHEAQNAQLKAIVLFLLEAATRDDNLLVIAEEAINILTEDKTDQFCVEVRKKINAFISFSTNKEILFCQKLVNQSVTLFF